MRSSLPLVVGAVDIGASGGRVVAGTIVEGRVDLESVHRFPNAAVSRDGRIRWDVTALFAEVLVGLHKLARRYPDVISIGIDTWAVDYGLLDEDGVLLAEPVSYRDSRTQSVLDDVHARISARQLYCLNGLQQLPFTTLYQLAADQREAVWNRVRHAVLIPDLLAYWLTGELRTEVTNASTTGLLNAQSRTFSEHIMGALDLPVDLFPRLVEPGQPVGRLLPHIAESTGVSPDTVVVAVGSHDTASAVVGMPASSREVAYVSSGTWSLVGIELDTPVLSDASREANFTNEGGVDGRVRFLRNVGGLWLLQESLRTWRASGELSDQSELLTRASALPPGGPVVDIDHPQFIPPGDIPTRIRETSLLASQPAPRNEAEVVRCILDSLAVAYARTALQAEQLTGREVNVIHIVGGGSQNELLGQLTADLSGLPVISGPAEATALGNVLVQARAQGALPDDLDEIRAALRFQLNLRHHTPSEGTGPTRSRP